MNAFTAPLNTQFNFFDDGSQFPFGPMRFYQLILLQGVLTNGVPQTNSVPAGGVSSFLIHVPTNAVFATNLLLSATGPLNVWFDTNAPSTTNVLLISGTNGAYIMSTTGTPPLVPGSAYYLSVQNTNSVAVNFGIEVDFHLVSPGPTNPPPVLPVVPLQIVNPLNTLVVTNTATDGALPAPTLTYVLTSTVGGTNVPVINATNGVIRWTPDATQWGTSNTLTTVVTASGVPALSATNVFGVVVNPVPGIGSVTATNGGYLLKWYAPTNDLFRVEFTDGLPPVWQSFSNVVAYAGPVTATNGLFTFFDDGVQHPFTGLRFYRLQLTGLAVPANPQAVTNMFSISISTNNSIVLVWSAPTNNMFRVHWTTNLVPQINWTLFPGTNTSTTGIFKFMDTNTPLLMKFYELVLLP